MEADGASVGVVDVDGQAREDGGIEDCGAARRGDLTASRWVWAVVKRTI